VVVLLALLLCSSGIGARAQVVDAESGFVARIAQERAAHGLPAYEQAADLRDVARRHAQRMAAEQRWFHNPNLASEVSGWTLVAENVGYGPNVDDVHAAFMASSSHRDTILHTQLTQVGIGVARGADNQLYVVQVFRRPEAGAPPPTAPPPPPPTTAPAPPVTAAPAPPVTEAPAPPAPDVADPPAEAAPPTTVDRASLAPAPVSVGAATNTRAVDLRKAKVVTNTPTIALGPVEGDVPTAGWVGAFLLVAVVGLQAQTLRRVGLV
jgi:hypothetical protein